MKTTNCANKVLPRTGGNSVGRGGKSAGSSGPATLSESEQDAIAFQDLGLCEGDKSVKEEAFIAWNFLVRYPEMYVGKANKPYVTPHFGENALFENQQWDFFYLFEPDEKVEDPILLVPTRQLSALLRRINRQLGISLTIPGGGNEKKFYTRFGFLDTPVPRYLGRTGDTASYKKLLNITPQPEAEDDLTGLTQIQRDEFAEIVKKTKESWQGSGKGGARSKKNAEKRFDERKGWGRTTKRVQRYLGLREKAAPIANYRAFTGQEPAPAKDLMLDVDASAPFEQDGHVVFVCFDIETYEKNPGLVTELGFAILDTQKLIDVPPGAGARDWFELIQGRHIRIKEYSYIKNTEYVEGCPENFLFGESELVPLTEVLGIVEEIMSPTSESGQLRKVVVVGHDVKQDIQYLNSLDFGVYGMENLLEVVDNQKLHQHRSKFYNGQSLCAVLAGLKISYRFLHNAGNDAVYTLQSLLRLAVLKRQESLVRAWEKQVTSGNMKQRIEPDAEAGWSTGGEDTDGGHPTVQHFVPMKKRLDEVLFDDQ
ncbi:putative qde-2-interacting protein [Diaporthe ampelina]|uniref:Putative qde-2-interacting protein n=1 Tax=Diaporthe ampelina TaxID=1214573 RepID=A0A0G2FNJ4_9PEZI|nr:putative qde-2-interacting protein [Diaporthe ampelina]